MTKPLKFSAIVRFWLPLAATWLMMAAEGPLLAALIARLGDTAVNLAAYGVAYSFGLVAESPIIMLLSAATALARDGASYRRLRNFSLGLCLGITVLLLLLLWPPVFALVTEGFIGLSPAVARLTREATLLLLPWPAAIGMRRFYQGVMIRNHQTRRVAVATVLRLLTMAGTGLGLFFWGGLPGAAIGGLALSAGVCAELLATRLLARAAIAAALAGTLAPDGEGDGYGRLARFYLPLALTPFIGLSVHPLVTLALGKSAFPLQSLAVMPVLYALTFVFRAIGLSYQEVAVALLGSRFEQYRPLRKVARMIGGGSALLLALIAFTPLSPLWFHNVSGLTPELTAFARRPLMILALLPALTVWLSWQRALLMTARISTPISLATALEAAGIFAILALLIVYSALPGATAAALAYMGGRLLAIAFLSRPCARLRREALSLSLESCHVP